MKDEEQIEEKTGEVISTEETTPVITEKAAKELTESIKSTANATCILLQKAHDSKAWKAMGYNTWGEYIEKEFAFTRARSYQLLSQASVIKEVSEVAEGELYLTEKEAKLIKKELPTITKKIKEETEGLSKEEKKEKAQEIVDGEIAHAMHTDKNTFDEGKELANSDREKEASEGGEFSSVYQPKEKEEIGEVDSSNFYIENLSRTLAIVEAFPPANELAKSAALAADEKIELRNRIKYAISWFESMSKSI